MFAYCSSATAKGGKRKQKAPTTDDRSQAHRPWAPRAAAYTQMAHRLHIAKTVFDPMDAEVFTTPCQAPPRPCLQPLAEEAPDWKGKENTNICTFQDTLSASDMEQLVSQYRESRTIVRPWPIKQQHMDRQVANILNTTTCTTLRFKEDGIKRIPMAPHPRGAKQPHDLSQHDECHMPH